MSGLLEEGSLCPLGCWAGVGESDSSGQKHLCPFFLPPVSQDRYTEVQLPPREKITLGRNHLQPLLPTPHGQLMTLLFISLRKQKQSEVNFPNSCPCLYRPPCICAHSVVIVLSLVTVEEASQLLCKASQHLSPEFHPLEPPQGQLPVCVLCFVTFSHHNWIIPTINAMLNYVSNLKRTLSWISLALTAPCPFLCSPLQQNSQRE